MSPLAEPSADVGSEMQALIAELFPICRSITGDGLRETLRRLQREIPLELHEVPSGTRVLDWTVPNEWNIRDAWIANARGERVVDFRQSSLHVVNYSAPLRARMSLSELRPHLHTLPDHPDWVPYRTSYYNVDWGFCLAQRTLDALHEDAYEVCIDSSLAPGSLTYGELVVSGATDDEVLFSCHCCHPSLANDNLSAVAVAVQLARDLARRSTALRYTYRFLFIPGTIGSITWLARNSDCADRVRHGLVLSCLGDAGHMTYKRSRRGDALIDRAVEHVLCASRDDCVINDFVPYGYDERQYCSPGFNLPVGCLTRTPNGRYPEYHSSADNLSFLRVEALEDSLRRILEVVDVLEHDAAYVNLFPRGEPQLGRRGLYRKSGGQPALPNEDMAMLWVLNYSDGTHSLLDIAERSQLGFSVVREAAARLTAHGLLRTIGREDGGSLVRIKRTNVECDGTHPGW